MYVQQQPVSHFYLVAIAPTWVEPASGEWCVVTSLETKDAQYTWNQPLDIPQCTVRNIDLLLSGRLKVGPNKLGYWGEGLDFLLRGTIG